MPKTLVKPIVYDDVHQEHLPITDGQVMDPSYVPVDESAGNALEVGENGLKVSADALVSDAADNQLKVQDGKLYLPAASGVISADEGNLIVAGTDKGAFLDGNNLLSNGDVNLLTISEIDHKLLLTRENVLKYITVVSADEGNLISKGSDGGALLTKDDIISEDDDVLTVDNKGKLVTELGMKYNTVTGELSLTGVDGAEVGHVLVPTSTSALRSVEFTRSMPSADGEDVEGDYFVTLAFGMEGKDAWDGGDGVQFTTVKGTPAVQTVEYTMETSISAGAFPDKVKAIFMGQSIEQEVVSSGTNTFEFPDGSRLLLTWTSSTGTTITLSASFTPGIGIELGSFLRMTWLLADGSVQDVYLEMTDIYTAGNGLAIDDTGLIAVVATETGGLTSATEGVSVKVNPDGGVQTDANGVALKVDPAGGLQATAAGVGLKLDTTSGSVVASENGVAVSDEWFKEMVADEVRTTELITAGDGIRVETTADGRRVSAVQGDGIIVSGAGISVNDEWLGEQITNKVATDTTLVSAGDGVTVTPTATGVAVAADADWIDNYVAEQIKSDDTLLVKGNGITLTATESGRQISADAGTGVVVDTNGINVDQNWLAERITDKVKEDTTLVAAGDGVTVTPSETGVAVAVDETWLSGKITDQVRTDEGLVQAGDGVSVTVTDDGKIISANAGTGISVTTDGISVDEEWLGQQVTEQVRTDTALVVAGSGLTEVVGTDGKTLNVGPGAGISVTENAIAVDTTWLKSQIDERVESGTLVAAGDGVDIEAADGTATIAVDDTVVRTSGNQTIAGEKLFTSDPIVKVTAADAPNVDLQYADTVVKGVTPTPDGKEAGVIVYDSTGDTGGMRANQLGSLSVGHTEEEIFTSLRAFQPVENGNVYTYLKVAYPADGDPYATAPTTPMAASGNEIVTVNYLKGANSGVVHTTGSETISGNKTFNGSILFTKDLQLVGHEQSDDTSPQIDAVIGFAKGTTPTNAVTSGFRVLDTEDQNFAALECSIGTNGNISVQICAYKNIADNSNKAQIQVVNPKEGDAYSVAPSTRATPIANEIITYDFLTNFSVKAPSTWYERPELMTTNKTSVTIPADTQVVINGQFFRSTADTTLQTSGVASAGTDIYVYAVNNSGTLGFVLSPNSTVPTGYNATNSRKIGGMHCLCADVGTISGHPLSGYVAGDILPASVWDLKHRAHSENEGMLYIAEKNIWVDIYLGSWDGGQLVSSFGGTTADGYSAEPFHADKFTEKFGEVGKRNPWRHEFMVFAKGSNEGTNIQGTADPVTTGGHVDTAGRRMISKDGLEDCAGALWQWTEDLFEGGAYGTYTAESGNRYLSGYNWNMAGDWTSEEAVNPVNAVWNPDIDGDGTAYGGAWGLPRRLLVGARWDNGLRCGSRAVHCDHFPSCRHSNCGGRGVSEPRSYGS